MKLPFGVQRSRLLVAGIMALMSATADGGQIRLDPMPGQADRDCVEISGVAAGEFDPLAWEKGGLNFVPDTRGPLIAPRLAGSFRNIYAPSVVALPAGWQVFYGGWDGVASGNDRIYTLFTSDFVDFSDRRTVVEHGAFQHVCNVTAATVGGGFDLICTAYPDGRGRNKPASFNLAGIPTEPYIASERDLISLEGYGGSNDLFPDADTNGMNVLLREGGERRMYFGDFRRHGHVHRASSSDGRRYRYEGPCLDTPHMVNDVKRFTAAGRPVYLMGLHGNTDRLWWTSSADGLHFGPERELARALGERDRYIVAIGWVVRDGRVLGFLYGAGAVGSLDRNRIFARWLQKKVAFTEASGRAVEVVGGLGPDRQVLRIGVGQRIRGKLRVCGENGGDLGAMDVELTAGEMYRLRVE
jgi:hypothetical protein